MAPNSIPQLTINPRPQDVATTNVQTDYQNAKQAGAKRKRVTLKNDSPKQKIEPPARIANAKCNTCHLSFFTDLGLRMHLKYHNFAIVLPTMENVRFSVQTIK